jgi:hypothetical protein
MGDTLKIQIVVDAAQVTAGMNGVTSSIDQATAKIKAAFGSVEKAPEGIRNALMILTNQATMSGEAVALATAAISQLGGSASAAAPQVQSAGNAAADTAAKMTSMERAMALATGRMAGMAAGAGMLGGALGRVAAASSAVGPLLAAAFPVIAVAAFVDIAVMAYEKIIDVTSAWAGWDKEAQKMYGLMVSLNQQTIAFNANLAIEKLRLNEIGLTGSALGLQKQKDLTTELTIRTDELAASLKRQAEIQAQLQGKARTIDVMNPRTRTAQSMTVIDKPEKDEVARLNQELEEAQKNTQRLRGEIEKLKEVSIPAEAKTTQVDQDKERATALEKSEELYERNVAESKKLAEADLREFEARKHLTEEAEKALDKNDSFDQDIRDMRLRDDADEASTDARLGRERAASITSIEIEQEHIKELARLGQISSQDEVARLNALEAQKLQIEKAYIQQRIDTILARLGDDDAEEYKKDKAEWDRLLNEKQKSEDQYLKNRQKNIDSAATTEQKTWTTLMGKINSAFDQSISGLLHGTMTFRKAFANLLDSLLSDFVSFLARKVEKWAEEHLLELALHSTFLTNLLGLDVANDAAKTAAGAATADLQVTQQAGIAGAAGFASVMASVPFPANIALAPEVMAAAISATLGNLALASAAGGWDVPRDTLAMVHANEMILPASISSGLKDMIGSGGSGGQGITVNYNGDFSAIDGRGMEEAFAKNSASLAKVIRREIRRSNAI